MLIICECRIMYQSKFSDVLTGGTAESASSRRQAMIAQQWTIRWHLFLRTLQRSEANKTAKSRVHRLQWFAISVWFTMIYLFKPFQTSMASFGDFPVAMWSLAGSWFWPSQKPERRFLSQWDFENNTHSTGIEERNGGAILVTVRWQTDRDDATVGWLIQEVMNIYEPLKKHEKNMDSHQFNDIHGLITNGALIRMGDARWPTNLWHVWLIHGEKDDTIWYHDMEMGLL